MAGGIMYPENQSYFIALDEQQLRDIWSGEKEINTDLFIKSAENIENFRDLPIFRDALLKDIRKKLTISLLDDNITSKLQINWYDEEWNIVALKESDNVKIEISKQLIDAILSKEWSYQCSDDVWNRIIFYAHDDENSIDWKQLLEEEFKAYKQKYNI